jgi:hypothetical protein
MNNSNRIKKKLAAPQPMFSSPRKMLLESRDFGISDAISLLVYLGAVKGLTVFGSRADIGCFNWPVSGGAVIDAQCTNAGRTHLARDGF